MSSDCPGSLSIQVKKSDMTRFTSLMVVDVVMMRRVFTVHHPEVMNSQTSTDICSVLLCLFFGSDTDRDISPGQFLYALFKKASSAFFGYTSRSNGDARGLTKSLARHHRPSENFQWATAISLLRFGESCCLLCLATWWLQYVPTLAQTTTHAY